MTNTSTPSEPNKLTHRGTSLNVLFRGWLKSSGVNFKTPTPVKRNDAKMVQNRANKGIVLACVHKHNQQASRILRVKMYNESLIIVIMLNRIDFSSLFVANKALFNIINLI